MIKLDKSTTSTLVTCDECPHWFSFKFEYTEAEESACRHERNVHPDTTVMRDRAATRARVNKYRRAAM